MKMMATNKTAQKFGSIGFGSGCSFARIASSIAVEFVTSKNREGGGAGTAPFAKSVSSGASSSSSSKISACANPTFLPTNLCVDARRVIL